MRWFRILCITLAALLVFPGCSSRHRKPYTIAIDPSFFPLNIEGKEDKVYIFIHDLLFAIAERENLSFVKVMASWDSMVPSLKSGNYDAIISAMPPYNFNKEQFDFSDPLLQVGPSLVVAEGSDIRSLQEMASGVLYVSTDTQKQEMQRRFPDMVIYTYVSAAKALEKLAAREIDGVLLETVQAVSYVHNIYTDALHIVEGPLGTEALRLVTRKGAHPRLIASVNRAAHAMKEESSYTTLARKWQVLPPG